MWSLYWIGLPLCGVCEVPIKTNHGPGVMEMQTHDKLMVQGLQKLDILVRAQEYGSRTSMQSLGAVYSICAVLSCSVQHLCSAYVQCTGSLQFLYAVYRITAVYSTCAVFMCSVQYLYSVYDWLSLFSKNLCTFNMRIQKVCTLKDCKDNLSENTFVVLTHKRQTTKDIKCIML